jgi:ATP-binding protein involved in chromosome partitioning
MAPTQELVTAALATVIDPEIRRPITDLDMVKSIDIAPDGVVRVGIFLTVAGCPLKDTIRRDVTNAVAKLDGVAGVQIELDVMSTEQRKQLQTKLRGDRGPEKEIPFNQPGSLTRVFAVASGKGGVGKSSVTVNLAAAMASNGMKVGIVDADIYGHSIPRMLGAAERPTKVEDMIMPPSAHGVKVVSIGMFTPGNAAVVWRGPMLDRALHQFLADVYWGDLDVLLLDLPPGTGDIAISVAQRLPTAEILVVTTPQMAAAEVAERAGSIAAQTHQQIAGVIENMAWLPCPTLRRAHRRVRGGRRPDGRRRAHPHTGRPRPAPGPGPDRPPAPRGRRRGQAAGPDRARLPGGGRAPQDRLRPQQTLHQPQGPPPRPLPQPLALLQAGAVLGARLTYPSAPPLVSVLGSFTAARSGQRPRRFRFPPRGPLRLRTAGPTRRRGWPTFQGDAYRLPRRATTTDRRDRLGGECVDRGAPERAWRTLRGPYERLWAPVDPRGGRRAV